MIGFNSAMDGDPYPHLSNLCGITAFRLPPRPLPALQLSADHHTSYPIFGPIPDHLSRYLCYDYPFAESHSSSSSSNPHSPSDTIIHHLLLPSPSPSPSPSPPPCPNFTTQISLVSCDPDSRQNQVVSLVHEREILPPCVVNYQDSLSWTPEREGVGDSDYENWIPIPTLLPIQTDEVTLRNQNQAFVSVVKTSAAYVSPYYTRSKSAKRLALS